MAENINVNINVDDNGTTKQRVKDANSLAKAYDNVASSVNATMAPKTMGAIKGATQSPLESIEYGQARASVGTGAAGRDFAKQAQGLGGLVHVYATFAANLFAVSAAFTALSKAADTTNMVKGLDQLGAVSGQSLGSLSKKLVEASDGAISFRDSMEAVSKASTAGLSSKQLLELGEVAKKSSQALGLSMPDALSRLTRGVVKLEPELLDELGLFTKLGKATEDYARKVGKTVDSLTDYERRQAFANAVAKEGIDKYNSIEIPSNPYDKLLSSLKDVSQKILDLINTALTPLVKLLSESPNALLLLIGGIATLLVKQALPALGQYREGLRKSADDSKKFAEDRAKSAQDALSKSIFYNGKEIQAQKDKIAAMRDTQLDQAEANLKAISKRGLDKGVRDILKKDTSVITKEDIAYIDKLGNSNRAAASSYKQLASAITEAKKANEDFHKASSDLDTKLKAKPPIYSAAGIAGIRAESARKSASSRDIVAQAGETAAISGISGAIGGMVDSIKTEKLGLIRGGITGIAGAINILGVAVSGVMTVLSKFLGWVGVAIGVYELLDAVFSKNAKELSNYKNAISDTEDAVKAASLTNKKYGDNITVDSILAKSTALSALADATEKLSRTFLEVDTASQGWLDKLMNNLKRPFSADIDSKFREQVTSVIKNSLEAISDPKLRKETEDRIAVLTGASSFAGVAGAIDKMDSSNLKRLAEDLPKGIKLVADNSKAATGPLNSLNEGYRALEKSYQELSNTLINNDQLTKFGLNLSRQASLMSDIFKDPINSIGALNDILKDTSKIQMFPPEVQKAILDAAKQVQGLSEDINKSQEEISRATAQIKAAKDLEDTGMPPTVYMELRMRGEGLLQAATDTYKTATDKLNNIRTNVQAGLSDTLMKSFALIEAPLSRAIAQGRIDTQKTLLSNLPKTPEVVKLQTQLDLDAIKLKKEEISTTNRLINAIDLDRISREKVPLADKMTKAFKEGNVEDFKSAKAEYDKLEQKRKGIEDSKSLISDVKTKGEILTPASLEVLARNRGLLTQLAALDAQTQAILINGVVAGVTAIFDKTKTLLEGELKVLVATNEQYYESLAFRQLAKIDKDKEIAARKAQEQAASTTISNLPKVQEIAITTKIQEEAEKRAFPKGAKDSATAPKPTKGMGAVAAAAKESTDLKVAELSLANQIQTVTVDTVKAKNDYIIPLEESLRLMDNELATKQAAANLDSAAKQISLETLAAERANIDVLANQGVLFGEELKIKLDINAVKTREIEHEQKLGQLEQQKYESLLAYDRLKKQTEDPAEQKRLEDLQATATRMYDSQIAGENKLYQAKSATAKLTESLSDRQIQYEGVFKNSFNNMADAMLEFAKTGKFSFSDLANSLLVEIARIELRLQASAMWSLMRPSFAGLFPKASDVSGSSFMNSYNAIGASAKGNAFPSGIQAFAQGGAFTNSIVNSPTLFRFAKGAGMMGEAGPEAIMPLKRDSNGNLGVRGGNGGSQTNVVVNNYSNAKATTKETTDSKGNRKIEVVIGDIVAGELGRSGSAMQQSLGNNFNARPAMARR